MRDGYYQNLCANGHLSMCDAWETNEQDKIKTCPHCDAVIVLSNFVDESTCEEVGKVNFQLLRKVKCDHCGHVKEKIYRKPGHGS